MSWSVSGGLPAYVTSKHGVVGPTKTAAPRMATKGTKQGWTMTLNQLSEFVTS